MPNETQTLRFPKYPYPGLRSFEPHEERIFRGRQRHIDELLQRLGGPHRFLAVVGTSGSGKSSLVRAGLLPALDRGYLAGATSRWRVVMFMPGMAPIQNLSASLAKAGLETTEERLRVSGAGLIRCVCDGNLDIGESVLIVVDQFEELFRFQRQDNGHGESEAALFVDLLLTAAKQPQVPIYVLLTMRSDFLSDCARFEGLAELLSNAQYLIPRLTRVERQQAIEEPLRLFNAEINPLLVERLLNDSSDQVDQGVIAAPYRGGAPDSLPVLQHALMRTYLQWVGSPEYNTKPIDFKHYSNIGEMSDAIDWHADHVFDKELTPGQRNLTERIFRCITTTELGRPVRRPTMFKDLVRIIGVDLAEGQQRNGASPTLEDVAETLTILGKGENFFVRRHADSSVDISHESLIWKWKLLSQWVALEAASAELYRDLAKDAQGGTTWGEPKLSSAVGVRERDAWNEEWARQYSDTKFTDVEAFIDRSRTAARNEKRLRRFGWAATAAMIILGVVLYYSSRQAFLKESELKAVSLARDSLKADLEKRQQEENNLKAQIAALSADQGVTKEDRDRIRTQKASLQAQLAKSQEDSKRVEARVQDVTNVLASVKSLQSQLEQAQRERDAATQKAAADVLASVKSSQGQLEQAQRERDAATQKVAAETKRRQDAESYTAQLEARLISLKDLDAARSALSKEAPKQDTVAQTPGQPAPLRQTAPPMTIASPGTEPRVLESSGIVRSVAWSSDGSTLASGGRDNRIRLFNAASGGLLRTLTGQVGIIYSIAWSPDGRRLASGSRGGPHFWDADTGTPRKVQSATDLVESVAWSRDGMTLASGGENRPIELWDGVRTTFLRTLEGCGGPVNSLAWSPDGKTLASGHQDGPICLWDATNRSLIRRLGALVNTISSVAWSPDGNTLASASLAGTIYLWNVSTGQPLGTLRADRSSIRSVAWSPDGKTLASGSSGGTIYLWNLSTGRPRTLQRGTGPVLTIAWSPDGKTLASGSAEGAVLWPVE